MTKDSRGSSATSDALRISNEKSDMEGETQNNSEGIWSHSKNSTTLVAEPAATKNRSVSEKKSFHKSSRLGLLAIPTTSQQRHQRYSEADPFYEARQRKQLDRLSSRLQPIGIRRQVLSGFWRREFGRIRLRWNVRAKRVIDLVLCTIYFAWSLPLFAIFAVPAVLTGWRPRLHRLDRIGYQGQAFHLLEFDFARHPLFRAFGFLGLHRIPSFWNVARGEMAVVGPRALSPEEYDPRQEPVRKRLRVRPGLLGLWWIRRRANVAFEDEWTIDAEYVDSWTFRGDLGLLLRAIPAALYGEAPIDPEDELDILGLHVDNFTLDECIRKSILQLYVNEPNRLCFVNADCANSAYKDDEYRHVINSAGMVLADGIGMKLAGRLLRQDIRENVNGTDMFPRLCRDLETTGKKIFLLGGKPGVAEGVRDWIRSHYPQTIVCGYQHGYFSAEENAAVVEKIRKSGTDLLLVAFGAPRQDLWIAENLEATGARLGVGVGGLFDFFSGRIPRAPQWMRDIGMEWFYRFLQEPRRMWKRYFIGNFVFLSRVLREKFFGSQFES